jgi:transposase
VRYEHLKIDNIDIEQTVNSVKTLLQAEKNLSPALRSSLELLLMLVSLLLNRMMLNSKNSSKPPSADPNREKVEKKARGNKKPGGQNGHKGSTLKQVDDPDEILQIQVDRRTLPKALNYREVGVEKRQVIDIDISRYVTEYQAQILEDEQGNQFIAPFPDGVSKAVQYGTQVKVNAVYLSQYQLIPYDRVKEHFQDQVHIPISAGSIYNFNQEAYDRLEHFEAWLIGKLPSEALLHADETGINIAGKRQWLHCVSTPLFTLYQAHAKRGKEAMDELGVLPHFKGVLCHDHWKPYYRFHCLHALCNAHHLRELERAWEQDKQQWAKEMQTLLLAIRTAVEEAGGELASDQASKWYRQYRSLLEKAELECPAPDESQRKGKRGKLKRSKSRNLLERLQKFEQDTLRFVENKDVPFTNNQGENDLRMTKVQQKVSGCFRSMKGAQFFCRIRGYLSTCKKHGLSATQALTLLFNDKSPDFMRDGLKHDDCA